MNKTVNINLAGILFHIDEDAFKKLQNYLEAIKRSFSDEQGRDEIIADIEARIAELFNEKKESEGNVIGQTAVDEVIEIMGQPEDYHVDEDLFDDVPKAASQPRMARHLFRDPTDSYVGGVTSGLGHYFTIDPIWLRLLWIILTLSSGGAFILIYVCLWIFVPEAKTTADQLAMRGEPINISNIERKIKEGFDNVTDSVKNADYKKYGNKVKNSSATFFDNLGNILKFVIKSFGKIIGVFLIFISGTMIISLFLALFGVTTFNISDAPWIDYVTSANIGAPLWLASLLVFLTVGIPFFFLFILGLKMVINNLKSIGRPAKLTLLGIWLIAFISIGFLGIRQATERAFNASVTQTETLTLNPTDTLKIQMVKNERYIDQLYQNDGFEIRKNERGEKVLVLQDIKIYIKSIKTNTPSIKITKKAEGNNYDNAKQRAEALQYQYVMDENTLLLDGYALSDYAQKYADQKIKVTLFIPESMTLYADNSTRDYNNYRSSDGYSSIRDKEGHYIQLKNGSVLCPSCPAKEEWENSDWDNDDEKGIDIDINDDGENFNLKIDKNGIRINNKPIIDKEDWNEDDGLDINFDNDDGEKFNLKIDENGIRINNKPVNVDINENGIKIKKE